jgi:hypothetical protein
MLKTSLLAGLIVVAACSGDAPVGPTFATPADFARHVDSLFQASMDSGFDRQTFLTYLEYPPAFGATPVAIGVAVKGGGTQHWNAYVWQDIGPSGFDSATILVAYSDPSAKNGFFLYQNNGGPGGAIELISDTTVIAVNSTQFSISHGVPSGACTEASGLTSEDLIYAELHYTCQPATFRVTAAAEVPGLLVGDSATMHVLNVSIPEIMGPRLQTH